MLDHPPAADWERLIQGSLSSFEKLRLLPHLLQGCPHCCNSLARHGGMDFPGEAGGEEYATAVKRAIATVTQIEPARQSAAAVLAALLAGYGETARSIARTKEDLSALRGLPRVQALLEAVSALRHEDPRGMLRFAKLARYAADHLRMREFGRQTVADLRALAWAELATAYRICNELRQAEEAMNRAIYWCQRGSRSDQLLARVAHLLATLLAYQRRFPEGRSLLALVYRVHMATGNRHLAAQALITRANLTTWEGDHRQALVLMRQGFDLLDPERDPKLQVQTLWNMIWLLAELGHFRAARRLLWRSHLLLADVIQPHRIRWLEAKVLAGLDDFPRAEAAFRQARAGFVEHGQAYPAALVGLDLAALWARQGRVAEVFELAEEMIVTFRALRIAREAVAALLVLKRACQFGGQVLDLIDIAGDLLRHLERQPARPRGYSGSFPAEAPPPS